MSCRWWCLLVLKVGLRVNLEVHMRYHWLPYQWGFDISLDQYCLNLRTRGGPSTTTGNIMHYDVNVLCYHSTVHSTYVYSTRTWGGDWSTSLPLLHLSCIFHLPGWQYNSDDAGWHICKGPGTYRCSHSIDSYAGLARRVSLFDCIADWISITYVNCPVRQWSHSRCTSSSLAVMKCNFMHDGKCSWIEIVGIVFQIYIFR